MAFRVGLRIARPVMDALRNNHDHRHQHLDHVHVFFGIQKEQGVEQDMQITSNRARR